MLVHPHGHTLGVDHWRTRDFADGTTPPCTRFTNGGCFTEMWEVEGTTRAPKSPYNSAQTRGRSAGPVRLEVVVSPVIAADLVEAVDTAHNGRVRATADQWPPNVSAEKSGPRGRKELGRAEDCRGSGPNWWSLTELQVFPFSFMFSLLFSKFMCSNEFELIVWTSYFQVLDKIPL
jgi:hypothetical protein